MKPLTQTMIFTIAGIYFILGSCQICASEVSVKIIYPNLYPPYDQIVRQIAKGIKEVLPSTEFVRSDGTGESPGEAIILGSPLAKKYQLDQRKIAGMTYETYGLRGVTLHIDTDVLIGKLLQVAPRITSVILVGQFVSPPSIQGVIIVELDGNILTNYQKITELVESDGKAAIVFGIGELEKYPAKYINKVVDLAWTNEWVTVSSRPDFISSGLTLSVTPDYQLYGRQLAKYYKNQNKDIENVKHVEVSIGVRSSRHVGIDTRKVARKNYAELYP